MGSSILSILRLVRLKLLLENLLVVMELSQKQFYLNIRRTVLLLKIRNLWYKLPRVLLNRHLLDRHLRPLNLKNGIVVQEVLPIKKSLKHSVRN
nr:MAG TPA: hypothetical protein [Caudoviricetes sp.]